MYVKSYIQLSFRRHLVIELCITHGSTHVYFKVQRTKSGVQNTKDTICHLSSLVRCINIWLDQLCWNTLGSKHMIVEGNEIEIPYNVQTKS